MVCSPSIYGAVPGQRLTRRYVRRYLAQLAAGERARQRGYDDWRRTQPDGPWTSDFGLRHGGWSVVLAAARPRIPG